MNLNERILLDETGDTRLGTFLGIFGIFMVTIIIIFASTNAVSTGLDVGKMAPNIISESHSFGNSSSDWNEFSFKLYLELHI